MIRALVLTLSLAACTTIGHVPPPGDWPELQTRVHRVSNKDMRDQCAKWAAWYMWPTFACAVIDLNAKTCDIWLDAEDPDAGIEKHEHDHCDGRDHVGETYLRDLWEQHKRSNQPERKPT